MLEIVLLNQTIRTTLCLSSMMQQVHVRHRHIRWSKRWWAMEVVDHNEDKRSTGLAPEENHLDTRRRSRSADQLSYGDCYMATVTWIYQGWMLLISIQTTAFRCCMLLVSRCRTVSYSDVHVPFHLIIFFASGPYMVWKVGFIERHTPMIRLHHHWAQMPGSGDCCSPPLAKCQAVEIAAQPHWTQMPGSGDCCFKNMQTLWTVVTWRENWSHMSGCNGGDDWNQCSQCLTPACIGKRKIRFQGHLDNLEEQFDVKTNVGSSWMKRGKNLGPSCAMLACI